MDEFDAKAGEWDGDPMKVERARRVADVLHEQAGPLSGKRAMACSSEQAIVEEIAKLTGGSLAR